MNPFYMRFIDHHFPARDAGDLSRPCQSNRLSASTHWGMEAMTGPVVQNQIRVFTAR